MRFPPESSPFEHPRLDLDLQVLDLLALAAVELIAWTLRSSSTAIFFAFVTCTNGDCAASRRRPCAVLAHCPSPSAFVTPTSSKPSSGTRCRTPRRRRTASRRCRAGGSWQCPCTRALRPSRFGLERLTPKILRGRPDIRRAGRSDPSDPRRRRGSCARRVLAPPITAKRSPFILPTSSLRSWPFSPTRPPVGCRTECRGSTRRGCGSGREYRERASVPAVACRSPVSTIPSPPQTKTCRHRRRAPSRLAPARIGSWDLDQRIVVAIAPSAEWVSSSRRPHRLAGVAITATRSHRAFVPLWWPRLRRARRRRTTRAAIPRKTPAPTSVEWCMPRASATTPTKTGMGDSRRRAPAIRTARFWMRETRDEQEQEPP